MYSRRQTSSYKGLIRPVLEYACSAWDPQQLTIIPTQKQQENVQNQAARFMPSKYNYGPGSMAAILEQLELTPLDERRKSCRLRLTLFCKGIYQNAAVPTNILRKPKLRTRHVHSQYHTIIGTSGDTLKNSFMHKTLKDWNLLPHGIINKTEVSEDPAKTFASIVKGGAKFKIM